MAGLSVDEAMSTSWPVTGPFRCLAVLFPSPMISFSTEAALRAKSVASRRALRAKSVADRRASGCRDRDGLARSRL